MMWKDIYGYKGKYQISDSGVVKSYHGKDPQGKILSPKIDKDGYHIVCLHIEGKAKYFRVHRLVAEAFIPNLEGLSQVNHIDENKSNNTVKNLEWCDCKYNNTYGTKIERDNRTKGCRPFKCVETGKVYINQRQCARELGTTQQAIHHVLKGNYKSSRGYHFVYV